jgi:hypothetical protein
MFKNNTIKFIVLTSSIFMSGLIMAGQPNDSGASIWKGVNHDILIFVDENKELAYSIGFDLTKLCEGSFDFRYGSDDFDDLLTQQVTNPSELISAHMLSKGDDLRTFVFKYTGASLCHDFHNYPIASGTSDTIYRNNDYFYWNSDGQNANAWGLSTHGVLENTYTSEREVFNANWKCLADNEGNYSCKTNIRLK